MGRGVAWQVARAPGMELAFLGDISREALESGAKAAGRRGVWVEDVAHPPAPGPDGVLLVEDSLGFLAADNGVQVDAIVECTNTIAAAGQYCLAAIARRAHVILMNAEVDLALGRLLVHEADRQGVVVTSDAGDQHGVLATMIEEIQLWGFRIVQAGNIKGYLERHATGESKAEIAAKLRLSTVQCVAYTDGTKLNIEMALIGNGFGLTPVQPGMQGHEFGSDRKSVTKVVELFDFDSYGDEGRIDYVINAEPGGGVYVVGYCDDELQKFYLNYYKVTSKGNYHLFYRPYHLCHLETPRAIAQAYFDRKPVLRPAPCLNDVYAYAKRDLTPGTRVEHGIGGDEVYGLVDAAARAGAEGVPVCWLESEGHGGSAATAVIHGTYSRDEPIRLSDVTFPDTELHRLLRRQAAIAG